MMELLLPLPLDWRDASMMRENSLTREGHLLFCAFARLALPVEARPSLPKVRILSLLSAIDRLNRLMFLRHSLCCGCLGLRLISEHCVS